MTTASRLDAVEAALTPTELILRWLDEAHAFDDLADYTRWLLDQQPGPTPIDRLAREAKENTKARIRARPRDEVDTEVRKALRATVLRFELVMRLNVAAHDALDRQLPIQLIVALGMVGQLDERTHELPDELSFRANHPRRWYELATASLSRLHGQMLAQERLEARYFDGRDVLFPALRRRWDEDLFEARKTLILAYRGLELDGLITDELDECIPDEDGVARWTRDLLEPARVEALDKLGEGERAVAAATAWLRPKLGPSSPPTSWAVGGQRL